jgi:hypothetical protein
MRDAGFGLFSAAQVISALSSASTNLMDFADVNHQIGQAVKSYNIAVKVNTSFTGTLTTLSIYFQDCDTATGTFANTNIALVNIPKASLLAGNLLLYIQVPVTGGPGRIGGPLAPAVLGEQPDSLSFSPLKRFCQLLYVVDAIPTAGALDAWIDIQ